MLTFATVDDVIRWLGVEAPANTEAMIRRGSAMVSTATRRARYAVTPAGLPSDPDVADALRDAVCAQVEAWVSVEVDPTVTVVEASVSKSSIDGASVEYDTATAAASRRALSEGLCSYALDILTNAGLLGGHPWVR